MKLYILSTCDAWKSSDSSCIYYIGTASKAGAERLVRIIAKGIYDGIFCYDSDGEASKSEQVESLKEDAKHTGDSFLWNLNSKLDYGCVELVECNELY